MEGTSEVKAQALTQEQINSLIEVNQRLMTALVAQRESAKDEAATFEVKNVCGAALTFHVTDLRGQPRLIILEQRGESVKLTKEQVLEIKEKSPHFFEKGYLSAPDVLPDSPNVIRNHQEFFDGMTVGDVATEIEKITSLPILFDLFNFIENKRFIAKDEATGAPLTAANEVGAPMLIMKEVEDFDPKLLTAGLAIQRRIAVLSNRTVHASLDD